MLQWLIWAWCLNLYVMFLFCVVKIMHPTRIRIPSINSDSVSFLGPIVRLSISPAELRDAILDQVSTLACCSYNDISRLIKKAPGVWYGEILRTISGVDVQLPFIISVSA